MIYTSYLNNPYIKELLKPQYDSKVKIFTIMRYPSSYFKKAYPNIKNLRSLSPSPYLFQLFQTNQIDWELFKSHFIKELESSLVSNYDLKEIKDCISRGQIVILLCCEKDWTSCHRTLVGNYLESLNLKTKELFEDDFQNMFVDVADILF